MFDIYVFKSIFHSKQCSVHFYKIKIKVDFENGFYPHEYYDFILLKLRIFKLCQK